MDREESIVAMLNEIIEADKEKAIAALTAKFDASEALAHHPFLTVRQEPFQESENAPVEWRPYLSALDIVTAIVRMAKPQMELVIEGGRVEMRKIRNKDQ